MKKPEVRSGPAGPDCDALQWAYQFPLFAAVPALAACQ